MKKFKLLSSIAAVAAISCVAAASSMAADAVDIKINAAKSTADTKVIDVYYNGDSLRVVNNFNIQISGIDATKTSFAANPNFGSLAGTVRNGNYAISASGTAQAPIDAKGMCLLASLTVTDTDTAEITVAGGSISGFPADSTSTVAVSLRHNNASLNIADVAAVVKPAELGIFAEGEGPAVKAYKADAAVEGEITWFVTDGTNVATKYVADVTGGADVVVGLRVAGDNVANINYAAVAID